MFCIFQDFLNALCPLPSLSLGRSLTLVHLVVKQEVLHSWHSWPATICFPMDTGSCPGDRALLLTVLQMLWPWVLVCWFPCCWANRKAMKQLLKDNWTLVGTYCCADLTLNHFLHFLQSIQHKHSKRYTVLTWNLYWCKMRNILQQLNVSNAEHVDLTLNQSQCMIWGIQCWPNLNQCNQCKVRLHSTWGIQCWPNCDRTKSPADATTQCQIKYKQTSKSSSSCCHFIFDHNKYKETSESSSYLHIITSYKQR